jgi:ATP phosphoribosyltransferase
VQHGAADMGIAGKDVLLEHGANGLFELLDLKATVKVINTLNRGGAFSGQPCQH